tara:strand:- start:540 stop:719 length:180 start_codon:yes stop_codon:yes gene_type:complete
MLIEIDVPARVFNAPEGYKRLTINLPVDLHTALKITAAKRECTVTEIIENLLKKELKVS